MILITGGERAGKSDFAVKKALSCGKKRAFLATAESFDDEMRSRIDKHKKDRGDLFDTFEEPVNLEKILNKTSEYDVCVIDCMTTWLGNLFYHKIDITSEVGIFLNSLNGNEIIVTNEVGMGIIPIDTMTRKYVEELGRLNSKLASVASEVFLMVAGIAMKIK